MRVNQCDACMRTFVHYDGTEKELNSNGLMLLNFDRKGKYEKRGYFDLCPDCMRKLAIFLTNDGTRSAGEMPSDKAVLGDSDDEMIFTSEGTSHE